MERSSQSRLPGYSAQFLPKSERELVAWLDLFSRKLGTYQSDFGLTDAVIASVRADQAWMAWSVLQVEVFKNELSQRVIFKDNLIDGPVGSLAEPVPSVGAPQLPEPPVVPPGILPRLRGLVQRLQAHPAYTEWIGQELGFVPVSTPIPPRAQAGG